MVGFLRQLSLVLRKSAILKYREIGKTSVEILVPAFFTLLLTIGFFVAEKQRIDETIYSSDLQNDVTHVNDVVAGLFCVRQNSNSSSNTEEGNANRTTSRLRREFGVKDCPADAPTVAPPPTSWGFLHSDGGGSDSSLSAARLWCLNPPLDDICTTDKKLVDGAIVVLLFVDNPMTVFDLDLFLILSGFAYVFHPGWDNFGENSARMSLMHSGMLMLVGDAAQTQDFRTYCMNTTRSDLCGRILFPELVPDAATAVAYTTDHGAKVWAVVDFSQYDPDRSAAPLPMSNAAVQQAADATTTASDGGAVFDSPLRYTIRMNCTSTPYTFKAINEFTEGLGPKFFLMYQYSGFLTLQRFVDGYFAGEILKKTVQAMPNISERGALFLDGGVDPLVQWGRLVSTPMPTRGFSTSAFLLKSGRFIPLVMTFGFLYALSRLLSQMVEEKETRLREAMCVMGMDGTVVELGWLLTAMAINILATVFSTTLASTTFFRGVNWLLLWIVNFLFAMTISCFGILMSTFFSRAKVAALAGPLVMFVVSVLHYAIPAESSLAVQYGASLLPCTAYGHIMETMSSLVTNAEPVSFAFAIHGSEKYPMIVAMLWMLVSCVVYLAIAAYLSKVMPSEFGVRRHPLFCFIDPCRRWIDKSRRQASDDDVGEQDDELEAGDAAMRAGRLEPRPAGQELFVTTRRLRKVYGASTITDAVKRCWTHLRDGERTNERGGQTTAAVKCLNLDLARREIFVLLGHNGAGKSTAMHMLTSTIAQTSGTVHVGEFSLPRDAALARQTIGFCPQHNVLFSLLTVREHLEFFAGLKGVPPVQVAKAVVDSVDEVDLTEKIDAIAASLSGGQKRKLSVAISLIGGSEFVLLDEPTAGMDVSARRHLWNVLLRKKAEGRCLLLSTHYMDEADILGDRIAVMHQGLLHSCGSAMFLKSKLGVGYYLHAVLASRPDDADWSPSLAQSSSVVRQTVATHCPNAVVVMDSTAASASTVPIAALPITGAVVTHHANRDTQPHHRITLGELTMQLPKAFIDDTTSASRLFAALEQLVDAGGLPAPSSGLASRSRLQVCLRSFGLSLTTMEDVFVAIAEERPTPEPHAVSSPSEPTTTAVPAASVTTGLTATEGSSPVKKNYAGTTAVAVASSLTDQDGVLLRRRQRSILRHFTALFKKRAHCAKRDSRALCFQVALPIVFLAIALLLLLIKMPMPPPLALDASMFEPRDEAGTRLSSVLFNYPSGGSTSGAQPTCVDGNMTLCFHTLAGDLNQGVDAIADRATWQVTQSGPELKSALLDIKDDQTAYVWSALNGGCSEPGDNFTSRCENPSELALELVTELATHGDMPRWVAMSPRQQVTDPDTLLNTTYTLLWHNATALHALPLAVSILDNYLIDSLVRNLTGGAFTAPRILTTNHALPMSTFETEMVTDIMRIISAVFILIPFTFIPSQFVSFIVREKETKAKHLQMVSGAHMGAYWAANYAFDLLAFCGTELLAMITFWIFNRTEFIGDAETAGASVCLFFFYGMSVIPASYIMSLFFEKHTTAQNVSMIVMFFFGFLLVLASQILAATESTRHVSNFLCKFWRVIPSYALGEGIIALSGRGLASTLIGYKPDAFSLLIYHNGIAGFLGGVGTSLCYMAAVTPVLLVIMFVAEWMRLKAIPLPCSRKLKDHHDHSHDAAARGPLTAATSVAPPATIPDAACGSGEDSSSLRPLLAAQEATSSPAPPEDVDITQERHEVETGLGRTGDCLTVQQLTKIWPTAAGSKKRIAVNHLSFGVKTGEIFAFLGTNGAGKTTTMGVLTGDFRPTSGRALIQGHDCTTETDAARSSLGYCPQFDALSPEMNALEHMWLYGRLKEMSDASIEQQSTQLLQALGVFQYRLKPARELSGGNRRKLSIAIALVGNPSVVLLDEPSAGMDPLARRELWKSLRTIAENRSVVLTTHHLEEVEALAHRAAILVDGEMRCIGTLQHLKSKIGEGTYEVQLKVNMASSGHSRRATGAAPVVVKNDDDGEEGGGQGAPGPIGRLSLALIDEGATRDRVEFVTRYVSSATTSSPEAVAATTRSAPASSLLSGARIVEVQGSHVTIAVKDHSLSEIMAWLSLIRAAYRTRRTGATQEDEELLDDFAVNQPSMEQVFLTVLKSSTHEGDDPNAAGGATHSH